DPVLVDIFHWNAALEAAVVALAEEPILVFSLGSLLAFDRKNAVRQLELDVLVVQAGQLCRDLHFLVGVAHLNTRPAQHSIDPAIKAKRSEIKPAKDVIEHPVHLTVQRQERTGLPAASNRDIAPAIPRDEISHAHCILHCIGTSSRPRPARPYRAPSPLLTVPNFDPARLYFGSPRGVRTGP